MVHPPAVLPGGTFSVQVVLVNPIIPDGTLTVTSQLSGVTCVPAAMARGTTSANTTCSVDKGAAIDNYTLNITVTTDAGETARRAGSVQVLQVTKSERCDS